MARLWAKFWKAKSASQMATKIWSQRRQAANAATAATTAEMMLAALTLGFFRIPWSTASSTWPPSRGRTGRRLSTVQKTLVVIASSAMMASADEASGAP